MDGKAGGCMGEKPAPGPDGVKRNEIARRDPLLAKFANEVEPIVRAGMEEARKVQDPKERVGQMCLAAAAYSEVDGDSLPILREAYEVADKLENPFDSVMLLLEIAYYSWITEQDPLPVMARALEKVEREADGLRKTEALGEIAFSYAKISERARAEIILEKINDEGFKEAIRMAICELVA